jgi:RNAse (barnase) inhibitor barstar
VEKRSDMDKKEIFKRALISFMESVLEGKGKNLEKKFEIFENKIVEALNELMQSFKLNLEPSDLKTIDTLWDELQKEVELAKPYAERIRIVYSTINKMEQSKSQTDIISSLLEGANKLLSRVCIFVIKENNFVGWYSKGFTGSSDITDTSIRLVIVPITSNTVLKDVAESGLTFIGTPADHPENWILLNRFGGKRPQEIIAIPMQIKNKIMAVFYGDQVPTSNKIDCKEELEILTKFASMAIDLLPIKEKVLAKEKTKEITEVPPLPEVEKAVSTTPVVPIISKEEEEWHKSAKRLAKVLVSDIMLYHAEEVEIGRREGNIYKRLKDVIERSKETFRERVKPQVLEKVDYLYEELVKTVCEGDHNLLKGYKEQ